MCIGIIWNNSFLVGGRARAEARIDPRPLQTSRSTAHGAKVAWPLDYMGRARSLKADRIMSSWSSLTPNRSVSSFSNDYSRQLVSTASQHGYRRLDTQLLVYPLGVAYWRPGWHSRSYQVRDGAIRTAVAWHDAGRQALRRLRTWMAFLIHIFLLLPILRMFKYSENEVKTSATVLSSNGMRQNVTILQSSYNRCQVIYGDRLGLYLHTGLRAPALPFYFLQNLKWCSDENDEHYRHLWKAKMS